MVIFRCLPGSDGTETEQEPAGRHSVYLLDRPQHRIGGRRSSLKLTLEADIWLGVRVVTLARFACRCLFTDARLSRLVQSLITGLTSADLQREGLSDLPCLPRLARSRPRLMYRLVYEWQHMGAPSRMRRCWLG